MAQYNTMQRDIDLQEIISVLSLSSSEQEHMSFRLSDDYQPNYFRYSKDNQLQEITFDLSKEEESLFVSEFNQGDFQVTEVSPQDRICFILEDSKEQPVKPFPEEKRRSIGKKISLNRKTSIKASELLKRKITLKKQTDEFTKKYDDLFDEIFFNEKAKEDKQDPPKENQQDQKEHSLVSTNQNLSGSNATSDNNFSISRAIDEALINGFNSSTSIEPKNSPNPKIVITYESKIVINIKLPKEQVADKVEATPSKPKIKFSYGQTQAQIVSKNPLLLESAAYQKRQQNRLPRFLASFRSKSNSYPNFYSKNGFTEDSCSSANRQFLSVLEECRLCIKSLKQSHLTLHELFGNIRELYKLLSLNILNGGSKEDQPLLDYFLSKDWASYFKANELEAIRPRDLFPSRPFNELEFITLINGFEEVVGKIESEALLNAENPETIKSYMDGRDQLWGIQKNLRLLSEDLYLYSISHFNLPSHFFQSQKLLNSLKAKQTVPFDQSAQQLLKRLLFLQENRDIFGSSWLGLYTIECLCNLKR